MHWNLKAMSVIETVTCSCLHVDATLIFNMQTPPNPTIALLQSYYPNVIDLKAYLLQTLVMPKDAMDDDLL